MYLSSVVLEDPKGAPIVRSKCARFEQCCIVKIYYLIALAVLLWSTEIKRNATRKIRIQCSPWRKIRVADRDLLKTFIPIPRFSPYVLTPEDAVFHELSGSIFVFVGHLRKSKLLAQICKK